MKVWKNFREVNKPFLSFPCLLSSSPLLCRRLMMLCSETWSIKSSPSSCRMTSTPPESDTRRWVMLYRVYKYISFMLFCYSSVLFWSPYAPIGIFRKGYWSFFMVKVMIVTNNKTATVHGDSCHYLLEYSTLKSTKTFYCKVVITIIYMQSLFSNIKLYLAFLSHIILLNIDANTNKQTKKSICGIILMRGYLA